jgi:hypothetical protein
LDLLSSGMITRPLISPFICICMLSCSSPPDSSSSSANPDSTGQIAVKAPPPVRQEAIPRFKTLDTVLSFAGVWVNEIYFDSIRNNHSPRLDQGIGKSCIIIPDSTLKATNMVAGFHDGGGTMVVVRDGNRYLFYDPELKLPFDTIEPLSPTRLRIGDQYFRPLNHPDTGKNDWGILEEILFSGRYQKEDGEEVLFGTNGHITGLDIVSYYEPEIDYADRTDRQIDRIRLGQSHKKLDEYGFRFDKDTLLIYTIDCLRYNAGEHECDSAKFGELMWKLRKMPE